MPKTIIGVMGPGSSSDVLELARRLGGLIAEAGFVLLTGGRDAGVMDAASQGAKLAGGLVVGVLPGQDRSDLSSYVDIAIPTGMGSARNNINVLASDVIVACGMGAGTASEVALALKAGKSVVLLGCGSRAEGFFKELSRDLIYPVASAEEAMDIVMAILEKRVNN